MASTQSTAMVSIRELILTGRLAGGQRVTEESLSERLGMSRTPIRQAVPALAQEGLLKKDGRGYVVRAYSMNEVEQALEAMGHLEGIAARDLAARGATPALLRQLGDCLERGDEIFAATTVTEKVKTLYGEMNAAFHELIVAASANAIVLDLVSRLTKIPFISPRSVAFNAARGDEMLKMLWFSHMQHHAIAEAIERREAARLIFLFQEHAQAKLKSIRFTRGQTEGGELAAPDLVSFASPSLAAAEP